MILEIDALQALALKSILRREIRRNEYLLKKRAAVLNEREQKKARKALIEFAGERIEFSEQILEAIQRAETQQN